MSRLGCSLSVGESFERLRERRNEVLKRGSSNPNEVRFHHIMIDNQWERGWRAVLSLHLEEVGDLLAGVFSVVNGSLCALLCSLRNPLARFIRIVRSFNISRSRTGIASTPCGRMTRNRTLTPPSRRFDRTWTGSRSLER
jgi:hypothetical protein